MFKSVFNFKNVKDKLKEQKSEKADSSDNKGLEKESNTQPAKDLEKESDTQFTKDFTRVMEEEDTLVLENQKKKEHPATLVMLSGPKDLIGMSWTLNKEIMGIGRSKRLNNISIPYDSLSKCHFQILRKGDDFYIVDLKSTNKTYVDDNEIEPYQKIPLKNNSYVKASSLIFKFLDKGNIEVFSSQQVLSKAQTDPLTGIGNRYLLELKSAEYFLDRKKDFSLIVFDLDNFKIINDTWGHLAGDYVLKSLVQCVSKLTRKGDFFIRYGGDEFCLLTPNSFSSAVSISERIQNEVSAYPFIFKSEKLPVGISIGVAERLDTDSSWEDIYHRADKMSYERKKEKNEKKL